MMMRKHVSPKMSKAGLLLCAPALLALLAVAGVWAKPAAAPRHTGAVRPDPLKARAGGPPEPTAFVAGTADRLAKWIDGTTLGDSSIFESNGLTVFGRTTPLFPTSSDYHLVEMAATGTKTPLTLVGGSGLMEFWKDTAAPGGATTAAMAFGMAVPGSAASNDIVFSTFNYASGGAWNERARITNDGKLIVGTGGGTQLRLDVNGAAHVSGSLTVDGDIAAKFQDVAEWVPSVQKLSAGTVVVLDAARTNHVLASSAAYDTKVAGVVSEQPGVILGVGGEGKLKVATTGRVKVKVDATRGAIKVGDLLVTSGVEGVAMRSVPVDLAGTQLHRPGTIIGKALEPLESGAGEILVLLSLQ